MAAKFTLPAHLNTMTPPWSSLLMVSGKSSPTSLVTAPPGFALRLVQGKKCGTPSNLFDEFSQALDFPDYFGHNWDALEECLADFEWLPAKGYVLLITDAHAVLPDDEDEYETLLEVLSDAGEAWSKGQTADSRRAPFHAVFVVAEQDKSKRTRWELEEVSFEEGKTSRTRPVRKRSSKPSKR
ncbi:MAG: barstar family protein [Nitrospira sp.]|nr:barstar family protein [Nitrospira sp.]MBX3335482.1 barstar family protein [Nitrospira sp.]